jgi:hypothetical protein
MSRRFDFQFSLAKLCGSVALVAVSLVLFRSSSFLALVAGTISLSAACANLVHRASTGAVGAAVVWAYLVVFWYLFLRL